MSLTSLVLRFAAPAPQLGDFKRYLFIGPHPDDIEIGAGATAARLRAMGKDVSFLVCIDGRYGLGNAPAGTTPEALVSVRRGEARRSAAVLGVEDVRFLDHSDGGLYDRDALFADMARAVGELKPEVIFAPDPCVTSECHVDHLNVGEAARRLAYIAPYKELMAGYGAAPAPIEAIAFYMTAKPNRYVKTGGFREAQKTALECHESQFPAGCRDLGDIELYLSLRSFSFGLRRLCGAAEGFRVLGRTQMHCLPEAGK